MDQDADRPLGAAEDAGDLGGRHLVDEAQHDGAAPIAGKPRHGLPGGARLLAPGDLGGRVGRAGNGGRGIERLLGSPEAGT